MSKRLKVLIVDDSALIRSLLNEIISADESLEVVGLAVDPYDAREKIKQLSPDVITLDIEMPRMDGITFLGNLMRLRPMPVVMISTLTEKGADATMEALSLGAVDFIAKPKVDVKRSIQSISSDIISKIKQAAKANVSVLVHNAKLAEGSQGVVATPEGQPRKDIEVVAIGASTGGTEAIKEVLCNLPGKMPPILIAQHMPGGFTTSYANRLNNLTRFEVEEFTGMQEPLLPNHVYIANGDQHLRVQRHNGQLCGVCDDSEPVNRHKPAVDVLFDSVAASCGSRSVGVILTGMGIDGASGLGLIRASGGVTIAQDEATSVVWGMPRVAVEQNAAGHVLPLSNIANFLVECCYVK